MIIRVLCSKDLHFTISTPVATFVSMALSRTLHFEAQIPKAISTTRRARDSLQLNIALLMSNVLLLYDYIKDVVRSYALWRIHELISDQRVLCILAFASISESSKVR